MSLPQFSAIKAVLHFAKSGILDERWTITKIEQYQNTSRKGRFLEAILEHSPKYVKNGRAESVERKISALVRDGSIISMTSSDRDMEIVRVSFRISGGPCKIRLVGRMSWLWPHS